MELDLQPTTGKNFIQSTAPGKIKINNTTFEHSVIVSADILEPWNLSSLKDLSKDDLQILLKFKPEVILIGTGTTAYFLPAELLLFVQQQGVGIETMTTEAACRTYNVLRNEDRNVLAALVIEKSPTSTVISF